MIDRSGCNAPRHGDYLAYNNARPGCRCPDAKADATRYRKGRAMARVRGERGRPPIVPAWRIERRVQALCRIGYSQRTLFHLAFGYEFSVGCRGGTGNWRVGISQKRFEVFDAVYQQLSATPGPSTRTRAHAVRHNWSAPLDWDNIDDPDEVPANLRTYTPEETLAAKDYVTDQLTRAEVLLLTPEQMAERRKHQLQRRDKKKRVRAA